MNNFYVYTHRLLATGEPFYVGKGLGRRCVEFSGRSERWRMVAAAGFYHEFERKGLSEVDAVDFEAELIAKFGREVDGGSLVNLARRGRVSGAVGRVLVSPKLSSETIGVVSSWMASQEAPWTFSALANMALREFLDARTDDGICHVAV